jgi:hypothetical protein
MFGVACARWLPFDWEKMTDMCWLDCIALPMATRQADCAHLPQVSFFRDFIFANRNCSGNNWARTQVTSVRGQVKILFSHGFPSRRKAFDKS